jgi:RHS repeat-associated protein
MTDSPNAVARRKAIPVAPCGTGPEWQPGSAEKALADCWLARIQEAAPTLCWHTYIAAWNLNYRTNNGSLQTLAVNSRNELTTALGSSFTYDSNGNLTNGDGKVYLYDDENRLIDVNQGAPTSGAWRTVFGYDGLGRMRTRAEYLGNGSSWVAQGTTEYIYDGMRVIQERDAYNNPTTSYTRGTDLSGNLEGAGLPRQSEATAGGIGGLLARSAGFYCTNTSLTICISNGSRTDCEFWLYSDAGTNVDDVAISAGTMTCFTFDAMAGTEYTIYGTDSEYHALEIEEVFAATLDHHEMETGRDPEEYTSYDSGDALCGVAGNWSRHDFYFADGNGNITALVDTSQPLSASYRYDPFGNTLSQSGTVASANVYRFSSKEIHPNSGMYYYGYRFYDPGLQRWLNTDPIWEPGFMLIRNRQTTKHAIVGRGRRFSDHNQYRMVRNDPMVMRDPLGLDSCDDLNAMRANAMDDGDMEFYHDLTDLMGMMGCFDPPPPPPDAPFPVQVPPITFPVCNMTGLNRPPWNPTPGLPRPDPAMLAMFAGALVFIGVAAAVSPVK